MKLYYAPGSCSLSPHIVLRETGLDFSIERIDLRAKKTESGKDFLSINPKGQVPVLQLDNGDVLTEGVAIVQYLADLKPDRNLISPPKTLERYHQIEWLNFLASEMHKGYGPLFSPDTPESYVPVVKEKLKSKFRYIDEVLTKHNFICGNNFTVADAYLFTLSQWAPHVGLDITDLTHLQDYLKRIAQRPNVHSALVTEGLIKE
ncbi:glutathione S-transferase [Proteus hauseri ATCC 700826]|uniref:Glutathione S-transferase n=1 Tax=Proteus hauseri ATCC 700826 TaxID=1354271 RepID=A0AAJ3HTB2_PROHU|nr:glutathione transferase GstA [Proteus hauseri]OAT47260.1 glutathione S-transferase [Proteus hauseri ATCC 700826]